jgi:hypothetical protein
MNSLLHAANSDTYLDNLAEFFKRALTVTTIALGQKLYGTIHLSAASCIPWLSTFLECSIQAVLTNLQ